MENRITGSDQISVCPVCPHRCRLSEGQTGRCRARHNKDGRIVPVSYGSLTATALDPIEKKPLAGFMPGSPVLSVGSFGCNMSCRFCQNHEISQTGLKGAFRTEKLSPTELCELAVELAGSHGNIGVAYTYNEPLIAYEYVLETAKLVKKAGLVNVLVTNGNINPEILEEVLPFIDAMNIDLKVFSSEGYRSLGGDFDTVKTFIKAAHASAHIELTTLIVPGLSDEPSDMEKEAAWIAGIDPGIILHITRYFPQYMMTDTPPTDIKLMQRLRSVASGHLDHVYLGNV
ncbi:MAG: AmmeMemoRadiSam system radical SAM enzyme [Lachnospiraceae bacterium]|nr:AmmeMemoRadiSam system radical SAM enzyme [Lachnospiraceae bacterium]